MKKGYIENKASNGNPNTVDFVWIECVRGDQSINGHRVKWDALPSDKRGIVHKVFLDTMPKSVDRNASKLDELISELRLSSVNIGAPLMIDLWDFTGGAQFALADVNYYFRYLSDHNIEFSKKPIVRVMIATWETWYREHQSEAEKLLGYADLLLVQWNDVPDTLSKIGKPKWWEYANGLIKYDPTQQWAVVTPPVDPEPPVDPPVDPDPDPEPTVSVPKKWKVELSFNFWIFSGSVSGTIEADEEGD